MAVSLLRMDFVHPVSAVIPGAQGRILAVLAETTAELNLRTLARLADVSVAQASRVMPDLIGLGLVERREVPPSSQFRLVRTNVGARAVLALATARDDVLAEIGRTVAAIEIPPVRAIVFGSFARGEAGPDSDLDVVFVRPAAIDEDDDRWTTGVELWRTAVRSLTGNRVEILEVGEDDAQARLEREDDLWRDIRREGVVIHGPPLATLAGKP